MVSSSERTERCTLQQAQCIPLWLHLRSAYCVLGPLLGTGEAGGKLKHDQGGFSSG